MTQSSSEQLLDTPNGEQTCTLTNMHLVITAATTHTDEKYIKLSPPIKAAKIRNVGKYAHKHNWKHIL